MGVSVVAMTHNETEKFPNGTVKLIKVRNSAEIDLVEMSRSLSLLNSIGHRESSVSWIVPSSGVI